MIWHMILGLLLLGIPVGVLYLTDSRLLRTFVVSMARMVAQVLVLCLMVWVLVRYDHWWLNLLWLLLMTGGTTMLMLHKQELNPRQLLWPIGGGVLTGTFLISMYLLFAVLPAEHGLDARWFVPVTALVLGHTLSMTIKGVTAYRDALKGDALQYEYLRGNGASHLKAVMPFVRRAIQAVLAPTAANLAVTGLFAMPLLLCGVLMAGVRPINAFVVTVMLIIGCVAASVISLVVSIWLADRRFFDSFGKLL